MSTEIYQLTVNEDRTVVCYVETTADDESLKICNFKSNRIKIVNVGEVVFLGWLSKKILLIQTKHELITYDITTCRRINNIFLKDKIRTILSRDSSYFDYVVQLTVDIIEVRRYYFVGGKTEKIMSVNTITNDVSISGKTKFEMYYVGYEQKIFETLDIGLGAISDEWNGDKLVVENKNLECSITVNNEIYFKGSGYIDRAYIMGGYILFSFSNFLRPRSLYKVMLNESKECFSAGQVKEKKLKAHFQLDNIEKKLIGDRQVPTVIIEPKECEFKTAIYLHGGPDTYIRNEYLGFIEPMLKRGMRVMLLDYSGSISYGTEFYERLLDNNGEEALKDIETLLMEIRNECNQIFVIGESFGGYLAVLSAVISPHIISKSIAINGFTDYRYQYIFSAARQVMSKYFDITISKNNPIDLIEKAPEMSSLAFIHGVKDVYCPIRQVEVFVEKTKLLGYTDVKLIKIEGEGHYSLLPRVVEKFYSCLIDEII